MTLLLRFCLMNKRHHSTYTHQVNDEYEREFTFQGAYHKLERIGTDLSLFPVNRLPNAHSDDMPGETFCNPIFGLHSDKRLRAPVSANLFSAVFYTPQF